MRTFGKLATVAMATGILALTSAGASASWASHHPRRVEVNHRLANQNYRINRDLRNGSINPAEARALHTEDRDIRREERFDASLDGSHITRAEKRSLNQQENAVSRQIYNDAH